MVQLKCKSAGRQGKGLKIGFAIGLDTGIVLVPIGWDIKLWVKGRRVD